MNIRLLKKGDIILIICVGIIAALIFIWHQIPFNSDDQIIAVITRDNEIKSQIDLNKLNQQQYIYFNEEIKQVILVEKGKIRFLESECPDKTCVKTGWLTKPGAKAVCIPSKTVITVLGVNENIDGISY